MILYVHWSMIIVHYIAHLTLNEQFELSL